MKPDILKVTSEPDGLGLTYVLHYTNGDEVVIRRKAKRRYRFAHLEDGPLPDVHRVRLTNTKPSKKVRGPVYEVEHWKGEYECAS